MSHEESHYKRPVQNSVRLAIGAGDISEGITSVVDGAGDETPSVEHQPFKPTCGYGGYWALASGCSDISEGMVWVPEVSEERR